MELYTVDAFTDVSLGGNPAGVALFQDALPDEARMRAIAAEVGFSETAFILPLSDGSFKIRFFTPIEEVALCGHATVGSFSLMLQRRMIQEGKEYVVHTGAGDLRVNAENGLVWLDLAKPKELFELDPSDARTLLSMFALPENACGSLRPAAVDAGLADIMLPLASRDLLAAMNPDFDAIAMLSRRFDVTGVHACALGDGAAGYCRNFAPLYGIDEEAATGTSNGALTYYLYKRGLLKPDETNLFIQGEAMGKPSKIYTRLTLEADGTPKIRAGGSGVVRM